MAMRDDEKSGSSGRESEAVEAPGEEGEPEGEVGGGGDGRLRW